MRILVTGATGFIGRHLVARLREDRYVVRALAHGPGGTTNCPEGVERVVGDVCDAQAMKTVTTGCDVVYHLAGKVHALSEMRGEEEVYRAINADGTRHVLEGAIAGGARSFVLFSSVKAMGEGGTRCVDETFKSLPESPYGRSKLEAERVALEMGRRAGLHVTCLRFPLVYGPGSKGNLFKMIAAIDRGVFPPIPEFGNRRSMVHVVDAVRAAILVAGSPAAKGQCYIVTDEQFYSTRELYERICRALGKPIPGWYLLAWVLKTVGRIGDVVGRVREKRFVFDSDALEKLTGSACYKSAAISRDVGYHPTHTFADAVPEMIASYRETLA